MAQFVGSLPLMWVTWIVFLVPIFDPGPGPGIVGIWGKNSRWVLSLFLSHRKDGWIFSRGLSDQVEQMSVEAWPYTILGEGESLWEEEYTS